MVTRLIYNNKTFKILNQYSFKFSNNEVTFNDITVDFTGFTFQDLPYKYQEIKIRQADTEADILQGKVLFVGYVDDFNISDMYNEDDEKELTLTLLSPLKLATRRSVSLIGTYKLKTAITRVLQPLVDDGFAIKEFNVPDGQITINYVLETVENCMNDIGFKRNVFWYIDEQKQIFINAIDYLFGLPRKKYISHNKKEKGLLQIKPQISNMDYANIINFKNVRLFYKQRDFYDNETQNSRGGYPLVNLPKTIKKGDVVKFNNPIVIDEDTLREIQQEDNDNLITQYSALGLSIFIGDILYTYNIYISTDKSSSDYDKYVIKGDITFSDSKGEEGEIVLQRDSFFYNLITGFKWNGPDGAYINDINSITALRYTSMRFLYSAEINKLKGIISHSGQIEKTIDYNSKWTTLTQLISYARSLMSQNSNIVNQVTLLYDINPELRIGDIVEINTPSFFIQGKFAVKEITHIFQNDLEKSWQITLKSTDLISTYIDMFRPEQKEVAVNAVDNVVLSEYIEEKINETHAIEISEV